MISFLRGDLEEVTIFSRRKGIFSPNREVRGNDCPRSMAICVAFFFRQMIVAREVISGSGRSSLEIGKNVGFLGDFLDPNLTDFSSKLYTKYPLFGLRESDSQAIPWTLQLEASWSWNCSLFHSERTRKSKFSEEK